MTVHAYGAQSAKAPLGPFDIDRRAPGPSDVAIDILFCGVCHSDLHIARNEWGNSQFPCVPGHEIVGRVTHVGERVTKFVVNDLVCVGTMVDSCQHCDPCREGLEQYCDSGSTQTFNGREQLTGKNTYGGYSSSIVVREEFVLRLPEGLDPASAAPLLCAGITTYSPLRHWKAGPGKRVGVVGLGGLGHMAVKFASALGAEVTLLTSSSNKKADAHRLGATRVVLASDANEMSQIAGELDLIINTVAAPLELDPYVAALRRDGVMVLLGAPPTPHHGPAVFNLLLRRRAVAGSLVGGIAETQEMLEFCAAHKIGADVEVIRIQDIEAAYERMKVGDVKYRFVIDMASLKTS
jgi:alcohol dehydrogenase (NADP+)